MKKERQTTRQVVGVCLDILFFAVRATKAFQVSTIVETVADITTSQALAYLKTLISLGYIEKATCYKYQATKFAKDMCGVGDSNE